MNRNRQAILPLLLRPVKLDSLVRLGVDHDGGYLVDERTIKKSDILISFGLGWDWTFEKDFKRYRNVPILCFDGSVGLNIFFKKLLGTIWRGSRKSFRRLLLILDYFKFFKMSNNRHINQFVGNKNHQITVSEISKNLIPKHLRNIFFTIDIESSEYDLLEELHLISDQIVGLVIEFHEVDRYMEKILNFIKMFPLQVCHVHVNNFTTVTETLVPETIEVTFTSFRIETGSLVETLPNCLDRPNDPQREDYILTFI
jgi:hypothetical protein